MKFENYHIQFLNISKKSKCRIGQDFWKQQKKNRKKENNKEKSWCMVGQCTKNRTEGSVEPLVKYRGWSPKFIWVLLHSCTECTHWLRPRNPSPRIWAHIQGRHWSAKIDVISWWPPEYRLDEIRVLHAEYPAQNRRTEGIVQDSMETWVRTIETGMTSQAIEENKMLRKKDRAWKTGQTW